MENAQGHMATARIAPMGSPRMRGGNFSWRLEGRRIRHFLSWLGGGDPAGLRAEAHLFATLLPEGLHAASAEAVGRAATAAVLNHGTASAAVVRFFFSSLSAEDPAKALEVLDSLISVVPAQEVPALVRVAIISWPRLALPLARAAMARVPAEATCIWAAAESVVVGLADDEAAFPGAQAFGMAAVETQACGKPVVAFGKGAMEPIVEEGTGMFISGAAPNL